MKIQINPIEFRVQGIWVVPLDRPTYINPEFVESITSTKGIDDEEIWILQMASGALHGITVDEFLKFEHILK